MSDSELKLTYDYLLNQLNYLGQAYLHIAGALASDIRHGAHVLELSVLSKTNTGNLIAGGYYDQQRVTDDCAKLGRCLWETVHRESTFDRTL